MSEIRVDNITDRAGTGTPNFPNGVPPAEGLIGTPDIVVGNIVAIDGSDLNGYKVENGVYDDSTSLNGLFNFDLISGHIQTYNNNTSGNYQPNFRVSSTTTLDSVMDVGDVVTVTLRVASSSHFLESSNIQIDGITDNLNIYYVGGEAPIMSNGFGFDIYSFIIQKTSATPGYQIVVNSLGIS